MSTAAEGAGSEDELEAYLDALLAPAGSRQAGAAEAPARERKYRLVTAAGLKFALPAADVGPAAVSDGGSPGGTGSPSIIDLGRIVAGRDGASGAGGAGGEVGAVYLSLTAFPGYALQVDRVDECIVVAHDAVRWRNAAQVRPWLAGIIESAGAAVLSVHGLVREARNGD